jgi:hypothetical protein
VARYAPPRTAHPVVATFTGLLAWAGAAGLLVGVIDFCPEITSRLPFHRPVFAGIALAAVVAVPMTWTAWLCLHDRPLWRTVGAVAGTLLFGWIVVQLALIQTFSWLQPIMGFAGLAVLVAVLFSGPGR